MKNRRQKNRDDVSKKKKKKKKKTRRPLFSAFSAFFSSAFPFFPRLRNDCNSYKRTTDITCNTRENKKRLQLRGCKSSFSSSSTSPTLVAPASSESTKFFTIIIPPSVMIDSGWNCTPWTQG